MWNLLEGGTVYADKGNEAFKQGRYADAVGFYTAAIIANREEPTYPLNRSAAYLKLGKFQDAQRDCTTVLKLNPKNAKAFFRRGQAWQGLDDLDKAHSDFWEAHQIEPNNQAVSDALNEIIFVQALATGSAKQSVDPSSIPRRRRVPIEIIDPSEAEKDVKPAVKAPVDDGSILKEVSSRSLKPSEIPTRSATNGTDAKTEPVKKAADSVPSPSPPQPQPASSSSFQEAKQARDTIRPSRIGGGIFRASGPTTVFPTREMGSSNSSTTSPASAQPKTKAPTPKTLSDLVRVWDAQSTPEERWEVLSTIPPTTLPSFCKSGLEPSFLASIFQTLHAILPTADLPTQVAVRSFLDYVVLVPRFTTIFLFLSKSEKEVVREVWKMLGVESFEGEPGAWGKLLK
ncbi:hypothetical protein H1R20_g14653, partial [Candolleomyces eurysporus]